MTYARLAKILVAMLAATATRSESQSRPGGPGGYRVELRTEAIAARRTSYAVGPGFVYPLSSYARAAVWGSGGGLLEDFPNGDAGGVILRAESAVRFLLDPFAERARGFYAGAGLGVRWTPHSSGDEYLVLLLGIEGRPMRRPIAGLRLVNAVEFGLGDGARVAFVIRQARRGYR